MEIGGRIGDKSHRIGDIADGELHLVRLRDTLIQSGDEPEDCSDNHKNEKHQGIMRPRRSLDPSPQSLDIFYTSAHVDVE